VRVACLGVIFSLVVSVPAGCAGGPDVSRATLPGPQSFTQEEAIAEALRHHLEIDPEAEFPDRPGQTGTQETRVGGPAPGHLVRVKLWIAAEGESAGVYAVTLHREWQTRVNGVIPRGDWKYRVSRDGVSLVHSESKESILFCIK